MYQSTVCDSCMTAVYHYSNVMDDLYKILRALLSIKIPRSFAGIMKDIVSSSFDLFSSVSVKVDDSNMEDDSVSSKLRGS